MAMIDCKECGTQMSSKADACPKCGRVYRRDRLSAVRGLVYIALGLAGLFGFFFWKMQGCG